MSGSASFGQLDASRSLVLEPAASPTESLASSIAKQQLPADISTLPQEPAFVQHSHATYAPFTAFCFTVNYILGVGVLGMPFAFAAAGWFLSTVVLLLITVFSWVTAMWLVQAQQTAKHNIRLTFEQHRQQQQQQQQAAAQPQQEPEPDAPPARAPALAAAPASFDGLIQEPLLPPAAASSSVSLYTPSLVDRRLELNELIRFYCGRRVQRAYELCLGTLIILALWAYCAVFAGSMAAHLPIAAMLQSGEVCSEADLGGSCQWLYLFYLLLFALVVVPLTCRELTELKWVMIALAVFRFASLGLMMLTSVLAIYSHPSPAAAQPASAQAGPPYYSNIAAIALPGLGVVFPIAVSSQLFHHSIPNLSFPLRPQRRVPHVFSAVLLTTFGLYAALGICVGLFFGSAVQSTCTLNWATYTGGEATDAQAVSRRSAWAAFVSYAIVLFPPVDVLSAFPLNCITLANNVMAAFVTPEQATKRRYILPFRLLTSCLPLLGAALVKDLSTILHYTGTVGVAVAFLFPAAVQYHSLKAVRTAQQERRAMAGREGEQAEELNGRQAAQGGVSGGAQQEWNARAAREGADVAAEDLIISGGLAALLDSRFAFASVSAFAVAGLIAVVVLSFTER